MNTNEQVLLIADPAREKKDQRQRLADYSQWLTDNDLAWYFPDLDAYRNHLLQERHLKPLSAKAYVGAVRSRYRALSEDLQTRLLLEAIAPTQKDSATFVERALEAIKKASSFEAGRVEAQRNVNNLVRLEDWQIMRLLLPSEESARRMGRSYDLEKQGLRDVTAMGLMFCAGINETELVALQVSDVYLDDYRELRVHVPKVSGGLERDVPVYDSRLFTRGWLKGYLDLLQAATNAYEGPLFRGFYRGGNLSNGMALTPRAVQKLMKSYPVNDDDADIQTVTALHLHRTLARKLFMDGLDVETIQAHLGHKQITTTYEYIGPPSRDTATSEDKWLPTTELEARLERWYENFRAAALRGR